MSRRTDVPRECIRSAIDALPDLTRTVYCLHLFEGLAYPAIAEQLGLDRNEPEAMVAEAIVLIDRHLRGGE